jgi:hypothetical protein
MPSIHRQEPTTATRSLDALRTAAQSVLAPTNATDAAKGSQAIDNAAAVLAGFAAKAMEEAITGDDVDYTLADNGHDQRATFSFIIGGGPSSQPLNRALRDVHDHTMRAAGGFLGQISEQASQLLRQSLAPLGYTDAEVTITKEPLAGLEKVRVTLTLPTTATFGSGGKMTRAEVEAFTAARAQRGNVLDVRLRSASSITTQARDRAVAIESAASALAEQLLQNFKKTLETQAPQFKGLSLTEALTSLVQAGDAFDHSVSFTSGDRAFLDGFKAAAQAHRPTSERGQTLTETDLRRVSNAIGARAEALLGAALSLDAVKVQVDVSTENDGRFSSLVFVRVDGSKPTQSSIP